MMTMSIVANGHDVEVYIDDEGRKAVIIPYLRNKGNGQLTYDAPLDEWRTIDKGFYEHLLKFVEAVIWPLPGTPEMRDDQTLFKDIERFIKEHVWVSDPRLYKVLASWVICTWIYDRLDIAPRLIFFGTTRSGKTRAIETLCSICYRGHTVLLPTPPSLYRTIERWSCSMFIDEYQALSEAFLPDIDAIFKGGFQPNATITRCGKDNDLEIFKPYCFMALGTKGILPKEDVINRSITINMIEKPRSAKIGRRIDLEASKELRGRLLGFRLKVLFNQIDVPSLKSEAESEALKPIVDGTSQIELDNRSIDLASSLLVPIIRFKEKAGESIKLIADCQQMNIDELINTMEGRVFYALQMCYKGCPKIKTETLTGFERRDLSKLFTFDVQEQLNKDLMDQEGRDTYTKRDRIETSIVTSYLKTLGFRDFKRGAGNKSRFDEKTFYEIYQTNLSKYGVRDGCPNLLTAAPKLDLRG
jgi:hypothetical protein